MKVRTCFIGVKVENIYFSPLSLLHPRVMGWIRYIQPWNIIHILPQPKAMENPNIFHKFIRSMLSVKRQLTSVVMYNTLPWKKDMNEKQSGRHKVVAGQVDRGGGWPGCCLTPTLFINFFHSLWSCIMYT